MSTVDLCKDASAAKSVAYVSGNTPNVVGFASYLTDNDLTTSYGLSTSGNSPSITGEMQITFPKSTITSVSITANTGLVYGVCPSTISLLINGVWTVIDNKNLPANQGYTKTTFPTITGKWNNVTGIKHRMKHAYNYRTSNLYLYWYDVQCWGIKWQDIGIRVKTPTEIQSIPVMELDVAAHKVRVSKNGVTYGISLVETTAPDASAVRIYDGTTIKAFPKI